MNKTEEVEVGDDAAKNHNDKQHALDLQSGSPQKPTSDKANLCVHCGQYLHQQNIIHKIDETNRRIDELNKKFEFLIETLFAKNTNTVKDNETRDINKMEQVEGRVRSNSSTHPITITFDWIGGSSRNEIVNEFFRDKLKQKVIIEKNPKNPVDVFLIFVYSSGGRVNFKTTIAPKLEEAKKTVYCVFAEVLDKAPYIADINSFQIAFNSKGVPTQQQDLQKLLDTILSASNSSIQTLSLNSQIIRYNWQASLVNLVKNFFP